MTKKDFIRFCATKNDLTIAEATEMVNAFVGAFLEALKTEESIDIAGLGKFKVVHKAESTRTLHLPGHEGEIRTIPAKNVLKVKFSKAVGDVLNE